MQTMSLMTAALFVGVAAQASAAAQQYRQGWRMLQRDVAAVADRALRDVGTTAKQRADIRNALGGAALEVRALLPQAMVLADQILAAALAEEPDEARLAELEKEGMALVARGARLSRAGLIEAVRVLTPAQRAALLKKWHSFRPATN